MGQLGLVRLTMPTHGSLSGGVESMAQIVLSFCTENASLAGITRAGQVCTVALLATALETAAADELYAATGFERAGAEACLAEALRDVLPDELGASVARESRVRELRGTSAPGAQTGTTRVVLNSAVLAARGGTPELVVTVSHDLQEVECEARFIGVDPAIGVRFLNRLGVWPAFAPVSERHVISLGSNDRRRDVRVSIEYI